MALLQNLERIRDIFRSEYASISAFSLEAEEVLESKSDKNKRPDKWSTGDPEISKLANHFRELADGNAVESAEFEIDDEVMAWIVQNVILPTRHKTYLFEMTVSYLISYQEAMLKKYLLIIFEHKPESLKSGDKVTYDVVLSCDSIEQLISHLAEREVEKLGYGSIEDAAKYFDSKFSINFNNCGCYERVVEANYRRNVLVHNSGVTNEKYCNRTGHTATRERLHTTKEYVVQLTEDLIEFNEFIFSSLAGKFRNA